MPFWVTARDSFAGTKISARPVGVHATCAHRKKCVCGLWISLEICAHKKIDIIGKTNRTTKTKQTTGKPKKKAKKNKKTKRKQKRKWVIRVMRVGEKNLRISTNKAWMIDPDVQ